MTAQPMDWEDPYLISFMVPGGWLTFCLLRRVLSDPDGEIAMNTDVYQGRRFVFSLVSDMPQDIHDVDDVTDILNDTYDLGLY